MTRRSVVLLTIRQPGDGNPAGIAVQAGEIVQAKVLPPFTEKLCPVIKPAQSLARKAASWEHLLCSYPVPPGPRLRQLSIGELVEKCSRHVRTACVVCTQAKMKVRTLYASCN
jgi:hypothetical protein